MSSLWVYSVLFLLTAGESAAFLGLVVPGEAAVLGAGALASRGEVALLHRHAAHAPRDGFDDVR